MNGTKNHTKILLNVSIIAFSLMILLLGGQWYSINNNINGMKKKNQNNFERIDTLKNYGPLQIKYNQLNKRQIIINSEEFERANTYIRALTDEVQKQSDKTESIIDRDLNRLNLYMAVGIGFMTLLGIFVPILVNVLSVQDLRDKQKNISKGLKILKRKSPSIDVAIKNADTAIEKSTLALNKSTEVDGISEKIINIEEKTKKVLPDLCNLILQNAIFRFFNVSSIVLTNAGRYQNYGEFIKILKAIQNGFERCKSDSDHTTIENNNFQYTIEDFILFLNTERFGTHPVFNGRTEYKEFEELIRLLLKLKQSNTEDEETNYDSVINQIKVIIKFFKDKNVKDKPAA